MRDARSRASSSGAAGPGPATPSPTWPASGSATRRSSRATGRWSSARDRSGPASPWSCRTPATAWTEPVFAGCHRLNGNGELTGLEWVRESGQLTAPIAITNTHSVGVVRDALVADAVDAVADRRRPTGRCPSSARRRTGCSTTSTASTCGPSTCARRWRRRPAGRSPRATSAAGRGWSATSSRAASGRRRGSSPSDRGGYTVGVLVQANYGKRAWLRVDGVPVGEEIAVAEVPSPYGTQVARSRRAAARLGLDHRRRRHRRAAPAPPVRAARPAGRLGIARAGGTGGHTSGDLFIAFATGNRTCRRRRRPRRASRVDDRPDPSATARSTPLFDGAIEATEEAIVNALVAAETMTGRDGITAHALPHDRLLEVMARYGRAARRPLGSRSGRPPRNV